MSSLLPWRPAPDGLIHHRAIAGSNLRQHEKTLQAAAQSAGGSFHSQSASLQALSGLFGKDLPDALTGAQTAMLAAQAGAEEVEHTLSVLTSNPAFAVSPYNPPVLLSTAVRGGGRLGGYTRTDAGGSRKPFDNQRGFNGPGGDLDEFCVQPGTAAKEAG